MLADLQLETERLLLRPPAPGDLDGWAAFLGDAESARFVGGVKDRADSWRSMAMMAGSWALKGFGMFSLIEKETGEWVGRVGPWSPEGWPGTEVGWGVVRSRAGRGYAVEAATAAIDWAFDRLGWTEVIHCIDPANTASIGVARKLGSEKIGHEPCLAGFGVAVDIYGQSRDQWRARHDRRTA
jgi:RimJ/RimL family protein N-acetyltransferase